MDTVDVNSSFKNFRTQGKVVSEKGKKMCLRHVEDGRVTLG